MESRLLGRVNARRRYHADITWHSPVRSGATDWSRSTPLRSLRGNNLRLVIYS